VAPDFSEVTCNHNDPSQRVEAIVASALVRMLEGSETNRPHRTCPRTLTAASLCSIPLLTLFAAFLMRIPKSWGPTVSELLGSLAFGPSFGLNCFSIRARLDLKGHAT